jgi:predicted O-methyltransferase YrrM
MTPAMQLGRFRTWINTVLKRSELRRARALAWQAYEPLLPLIRVSQPFQASNGLGRFARHIVHSGLPAPVRYLEIGAFEGNSVAHVYKLLDGRVHITVIDPFIDYLEHAGGNMNGVFNTFTANMAAIGATDAVTVLRGRSIDYLPKLIDDEAQFDIIYIDGSHAIPDVMLDATLSWPLLVRGGLMIFDDYRYSRADLGPVYRTKLAIDAFVGAMSHDIEVLDVARQVFIRKN